MRRALSADFELSAGPADVVLLNACTVTLLADRKARQAARRIRRDHSSTVVVLIGCLADAVCAGLTRFDDAHLVAGGAWKARVCEVVRAALSGRRGVLPALPDAPLNLERSDGPVGRVRAHLKVQDGCSRQCAYCRPTIVRGASRSKSVTDALAEGLRLIELGFPEIVLTGINLAEYAPPDGRLADLVAALACIDGLRRVRIASINPYGLTDELLDVFVDHDRACPHFHVPLQSGDTRILAAMRRGYTAEDYIDRLALVRRRLPNATFGADLMVGFPGEDDAAFEETCRIVRDVGFSNTHIFRYSPRAGTEAARLPSRVPEVVKRQRADHLDSVCRAVRRELLDKRVGTTQDVLVEASRNGQWRGYTRDYLHVLFDSESAISLGVERAVHIVEATGDYVRGEDAGRDSTS